MKVKGKAVFSTKDFVLKHYGEEGYKLWITSLSKESKNIFQNEINDEQWFPIHPSMIEPTHKLCKLFFEGSLDGAWECGRHSADIGFSMMLKVFVRLGSTNFIIKQAGNIVSHYYSPSIIETVPTSADNKTLHLQITEFQEMDPVVEFRIGGWIQRALEISGKNKVDVVIDSSLLNGDPATVYSITWDL